MEAKTLTAADVAKLLDGKITVLAESKDKETGKVTKAPAERALRADDVLSFKIDGKKVVAVTADGRKREAEIR